MPPSIKLNYDHLKAQTKTPLWNFAGLGLIIIAVIASIISARNTSQKVSKLIVTPKVNDVFQIKLNDEAYTLYKVQRVDKDTVYFFANKFQTNQESGLSDLADKEFDMNKVYGIPESKLIEMNKNDEIIDIDRK